MRTILTRLAVAGVLGIALSACGGSNGNSLAGGLPNGSCCGSVQGSNGVGSPPAGYAAPVVVDASTKAYAPTANTIGTGTVVAGVSQTLTFTGNSDRQEWFRWGGTVPNLTFMYGMPGNTAPFNYGEIDLDGVTYTGSPLPAQIAVELTGGSSTSFYDVRLVCATAGTLATPPVDYRCLAPTNGVISGNSYGAPYGIYTTTYSSTTKEFTRPASPTVGTYSEQYPSSQASGLFTLGDASQTLTIVMTFAAPNTTGGTLTLAGDTTTPAPGTTGPGQVVIALQ